MEQDFFFRKVLATTSLEEFEKEYFEMAGFQDYQSYCQAINPIYVFENVKIPLMILNAEDDPVCSIKNLEPYKETIRQMSNIAVVTTKREVIVAFTKVGKVPLGLPN